MRGWRLWAWAAGLLAVCAILEGTLSPRIAIWGAQPDLPLIAVCCLSLLSGRSAGAALGFAAGLLTGALADSTHLGSFIVSRTLAGFVAGWLPRLFRPQLLGACFLATLGCTFLAHLAYLLGSPETDLGSWVKLALMRSLYNAVLATPLYLVLLRSLKTDHQR